MRRHPLFRLLLGIAILFAVLFPVFILLEGFRYSSILAGFFIPLVLYTLMFPLFGSLVYHIICSSILPLSFLQ